MARAAVAALDSAKSFRVEGVVPDPTQLPLFVVDVVRGKGSRGEIWESVGRHGAGRVLDVIQIGPILYARGNAAYWLRYSGAKGLRLIADKWLRAPASSGSFPDASYLDTPQRLINSLLTTGRWERAADTTVAGQKVVALRDPTGETEVYVAATGRPYPVEISLSFQGGASRIVFGRFNEPVTLTPPTHSTDFSKITST